MRAGCCAPISNGPRRWIQISQRLHPMCCSSAPTGSSRSSTRRTVHSSSRALRVSIHRACGSARITSFHRALVDTLAISDPRFATKLVGQMGPNEIGALATQDTVTSILLPGPQISTSQSFDFSTRDELLRYRRDVGASAFGVYASDRDGGGYHSSLYAADGTWQVDPSDAVTALVGSSSTSYPGAVASAFGTSPGTVKGVLWSLDYARTRHNYNIDLNLSHVADGFRADLGFLPQVGYDQGAFLGEYDFCASNQDWWQTSGFGTISNWTRAT